MQVEKVVKPKVTHRPVGKERLVFRRVSHAFLEEVNRLFENRLKGRLQINPKDVSAENLLEMRKKLVQLVKAGMLERKDGEVEIAYLACAVWFARLTVERRLHILEEWGD